MSRSHLAHLVLGLIIGALPLAYKILMARLERLDKVDPATKAILQEAETTIESELKKEADELK